MAIERNCTFCRLEPQMSGCAERCARIRTTRAAPLGSAAKSAAAESESENENEDKRAPGDSAALLCSSNKDLLLLLRRREAARANRAHRSRASGGRRSRVRRLRRRRRRLKEEVAASERPLVSLFNWALIRAERRARLRCWRVIVMIGQFGNLLRGNSNNCKSPQLSIQLDESTQTKFVGSSLTL